MRLVYRGNFRPEHSTESHVAWTLEDMGHTVVRMQEDTQNWEDTALACVYPERSDLFLWTQTYGYAQHWERSDAFDALARIKDAGTPRAGFHLDRWWGLQREHQVTTDEPFFRGLDWLFTADGDNDWRWRQQGINHLWLPPAVFARECVDGTYSDDLASDVTFVGSWRSYAHQEWWPKRKAMLDALRRRYGASARFWPGADGAVRGQRLNDLYASVKVVVGDSCLADTSVRYFSDRAFETVGRGGFLVSPWIPALAEMLIDGDHCRYFTPGDHDEMCAVIDHYLADDADRERIRKQGQAHVAAHHTYTQRMQELLATTCPPAHRQVPTPVD